MLVAVTSEFDDIEKHLNKHSDDNNEFRLHYKAVLICLGIQFRFWLKWSCIETLKNYQFLQ